MQFAEKFTRFLRGFDPVEASPAADVIEIHTQSVPIIFRRHNRARNYILRLRPDKTVVVTVPRRGSLAFARRFVADRRAWLEKHWEALATTPSTAADLRPGMEVFFRGEAVPLIARNDDGVCEIHFGGERFFPRDPEGDLRPAFERHLRLLAAKELEERTWEFARLHNAPVRRVTVRDQKSRWGSCSARGTISLNWRLLQCPVFVRDYIILHELMHLRQMNHSPRFWAEVEKVCPDFRTAEKWLKTNSKRVRS